MHLRNNERLSLKNADDAPLLTPLDIHVITLFTFQCIVRQQKLLFSHSAFSCHGIYSPGFSFLSFHIFLVSLKGKPYLKQQSDI